MGRVRSCTYAGLASRGNQPWVVRVISTTTMDWIGWMVIAAWNLKYLDENRRQGRWRGPTSVYVCVLLRNGSRMALPRECTSTKYNAPCRAVTIYLSKAFRRKNTLPLSLYTEVGRQAGRHMHEFRPRPLPGSLHESSSYQQQHQQPEGQATPPSVPHLSLLLARTAPG